MRHSAPHDGDDTTLEEQFKSNCFSSLCTILCPLVVSSVSRTTHLPQIISINSKLDMVASEIPEFLLTGRLHCTCCLRPELEVAGLDWQETVSCLRISRRRKKLKLFPLLPVISFSLYSLSSQQQLHTLFKSLLVIRYVTIQYLHSPRRCTDDG